MNDAPERTWVTFDDDAPWSGVAYDRRANADAVEYVRADVLATAVEREQKLARRIHMQRSELRWMNNLIASNAGYHHWNKIAALLVERSSFVHPDQKEARRKAWRIMWRALTERRAVLATNPPSAQIENAPVQSRSEISGEKPATP